MKSFYTVLHGISLVSVVWCASTRFALAQYWNNEKPRLTSEVRRLTASDAQTLLAEVCKLGLKEEPNGLLGLGYGCVPPPTVPDNQSRVRPDFNPSFGTRNFSDPTPETQRPSDTIRFQYADGVIYGHFLSPISEDAAISGYGGETHPAFWGGTLLLTKSDGRWKPVWYKGAIITRNCRKISSKTGREQLLCEEEDGGMGHSYHILYFLDLLHPKAPFEASLLVADSFVMTCGFQQTQSITKIDIHPAQKSLEMKVLLQHGRMKEPDEWTGEPCEQLMKLPPPKVRNYSVDFVLRGESFEATAATRRTLELFLFH